MLLGSLLQRFVGFGRVEECFDKRSTLRAIQTQHFVLLNQNTKWRWYERRTLVDGKWTLSGITTPINKITGQRYEGNHGYLDDDLVPESDRQSALNLRKKLALGKADPTRRTLEGRPPSQWLRSLNADEIKLWLKTIEVPEVGVDSMTFWTHLTRDHSFSPDRIRGLSIPEQAKLHSAAHFGY